MTYSKRLEVYPLEFGELMKQAAMQAMEIPMPNKADAQRLMGRLYAYKGALLKAAKAFDATDEIKELKRFSDKVQLRVTGEGNLLLRPLDMDPDARHIANVLADPSAGKKVLVEISTSSLPAWLGQYAQKKDVSNEK